ncbi:hypothetical protein ACHAXR_011681 [Thalassiosira sp. AJA248-18]
MPQTDNTFKCESEEGVILALRAGYTDSKSIRQTWVFNSDESIESIESDSCADHVITIPGGASRDNAISLVSYVGSLDQEWEFTLTSSPTSSPTTPLTSPPTSPPTLSPTSSPTLSPTSAPSRAPTSAPISFEGKSRIIMNIPATLNMTDTQSSSVNLRKLAASGDTIPNNIEAALRKTIREVARNGLDKTRQRVKNVVILPVDGMVEEVQLDVERHRERNHHEDQVLMEDQRGQALSPPQQMKIEMSALSIVKYELALEELCTNNCSSTDMYDRVTLHMKLEIANGGFTSNLQTNAQKCGSGCDGIQNANVNGGGFGAAEVVVQNQPTTPPTLAPTASPSGKPSSQPTQPPTAITEADTAPTHEPSMEHTRSKSQKAGKATKVLGIDENGNKVSSTFIMRTRKHTSKDPSHLSAEP